MKRYILTSLTRNEQLERLKKLITKEIKTSDIYYLSSLESYHVVTRKNGWTIYPSQSAFLTIDMLLTDRDECLETNLVFGIITYIFIGGWFTFCVFAFVIGLLTKDSIFAVIMICFTWLSVVVFYLFFWVMTKAHIEAICKLFDGEAVKTLHE